MKLETVEILSVLTTDVWIESGMMGERHVMIRHEGCQPFTYASFFYDYAYTSNAGTFSAARALALQLGAKDPIKELCRGFEQQEGRA